jgi:hypothetical protein
MIGKLGGSMKTTAVTISVRWGSDFQKEVGEKNLMQMLEIWKQACEEHHRSTFIKIDSRECDV